MPAPITMTQRRQLTKLLERRLEDTERAAGKARAEAKQALPAPSAKSIVAQPKYKTLRAAIERIEAAGLQLKTEYRCNKVRYDLDVDGNSKGAVAADLWKAIADKETAEAQIDARHKAALNRLSKAQRTAENTVWLAETREEAEAALETFASACDEILKAA